MLKKNPRSSGYRKIRRYEKANVCQWERVYPMDATKWDNEESY